MSDFPAKTRASLNLFKIEKAADRCTPSLHTLAINTLTSGFKCCSAGIVISVGKYFVNCSFKK